MHGLDGLVDDAGVRGIERVREVVAADFVDVDAAHDLAHLDRVARLAATIAHREGLDPYVAALAAYVHDYHRVEEARTGTTVEPPELVEFPERFHAEFGDTPHAPVRPAGTPAAP